jgi:hypothetical protein
MEEKTFTLNIRQKGQWQYEITIPEIGVSKTASTLDSALNITLRDTVKHLNTHYLILVFVDRHFDEMGWFVDPQERPQTDLEQQAAFEVERLGIASHVLARERHLVFELSHPLTQEQAAWLSEQNGKLYDWYYTQDEIGVKLNERQGK